ncbi:MAG TPA: MtrB/PioB family outer membrane beta-barrel protein, partial [Vicinamibacterales bacterium]|nr:MtrB/PioB family outer membrane beta-barrel protein [Vicinamibacterales bacterium]
MRILNRLLFLAVALVPAAASAQTAAAGAQTPAAAGAETPAASTDMAPTRGWLDFGVRGTRITGDGARYERYRDLGDGLFLEGLRWQADTRGWLFNLDATHVARRDQRYLASFVRPGHFKGWANWDQIPLLLSRTTRTPYTLTNGNELRIPDATQLQLQGLSTAAKPAALLALVNGSPAFDLKSRRHIGEVGFEILPVPDSSIKMNFKHTTREGAQPQGGSFGQSQVVEFAAPIDHKLTDVDASAELERGRVLMRAGYTGSWFTNEITSLVFDNPLRATDLAATPSAGRLSLPVSNTRLGVNGMISVKMPKKSRLTAYAAVSTLKDDNGQVLPQTINSAINAPSTSLSRTTISGDAKTTAVNLSFVSRPSTLLGVNVRYRLFDYDNHTPEFTATTRVSYDSSF